MEKNMTIDKSLIKFYKTICKICLHSSLQYLLFYNLDNINMAIDWLLIINQLDCINLIIICFKS